MGQLVQQQQLSTNRSTKNPVIVWSTRPMYQLVFSICQNPKEVGFNASEGMDAIARASRKKRELPSSLSFI